MSGVNNPKAVTTFLKEVTGNTADNVLVRIVCFEFIDFSDQYSSVRSLNQARNKEALFEYCPAGRSTCRHRA